MDPRQDGELMLAAGQGDRDAFAVLVARHQGAIIHFIHRFLGTASCDVVEDLAQEVFLEAWKYASSFRPRAKVLTWLFRITTSECLDHRRRTRRRVSVQFDSGLVADRATRETREPATSVRAREQAQIVRGAIVELPPNQRAAILLYHFHELSYRQIADVLDTSLSAVESLLFRAKRTLAAKLSAEKIDISPQVFSEISA